MIKLLAATLLLAGTATDPSAATAGGGAVPKHLRKPDRIPAVAASLLEKRMGKHGDDLEWLLANVLMLNRENVEATAHKIATTPRLARPVAGQDDMLNSLLPARFFDLQEQLTDRANALAAAAHGRDDKAMAKAFGQLTETCVACHSSYLADVTATENAETH
jgi:cytochrome c556